MSETENSVREEEQVAESTKKEKTKKDEKSKKSSFFSRLKGEFKRCTWPKPVDLAKQSTLVIVVSLILGVLIAGIDWAIRLGLQAINIVS